LTFSVVLTSLVGRSHMPAHTINRNSRRKAIRIEPLEPRRLLSNGLEGLRLIDPSVNRFTEQLHAVASAPQSTDVLSREEDGSSSVGSFKMSLGAGGDEFGRDANRAIQPYTFAREDDKPVLI
jgi:hypothetical protein